MKKATIYLIRGGKKKTGFWFLPIFFNYRHKALEHLKRYPGPDGVEKTLTVIKFEEVDSIRESKKD